MNTVTHKAFRKALLVQLVGQFRNLNSRKRGRPSTQDDEDRLNGKPHFVIKMKTTALKIVQYEVIEKLKGKGGKSHTFAKLVQENLG